MNKIETGGPAFPSALEYIPNEGGWRAQDGITICDYFAAKALQGLLSGQWPDKEDSKEIVSRAYVLADLMLEARK